jgi:hypothetical protein
MNLKDLDTGDCLATCTVDELEMEFPRRKRRRVKRKVEPRCVETAVKPVDSEEDRVVR